MTTVTETGGPRVRRTDPLTSHKAAEGTDLSASQHFVYTLLEYHGPLAHFQLEERANDWYAAYPDATRWAPSRIRSACSELVAAGCVFPTGKEVPTPYGGVAMVWSSVRIA
jgi:hypothetical protein